MFNNQKSKNLIIKVNINIMMTIIKNKTTTMIKTGI